jgi:hypothetical protein
MSDAKQVYSYRQHGGVWYLYEGRKVIWEDHYLDKLLAWAKERGIEAKWEPLRIVRVVDSDTVEND